MKNNNHKKLFYLDIFSMYDAPMTDKKFAKRQASRKVRRERKKINDIYERSDRNDD